MTEDPLKCLPATVTCQTRNGMTRLEANLKHPSKDTEWEAAFRCLSCNAVTRRRYESGGP
jgi:hypothetical protein